MKYIISIIAALIIGGFLGYAMAPSETTKTVTKDVVVNPTFEFKVGEKHYCEIGAEVKPCEIVAQKSTGSYAVKYNEDGWGGGNKITVVSPSVILR